MFPSSCRTCGQSLKSKTQATHHRRLCRGGMAAKIAEVIAMPCGIEVAVAGPDRGCRLFVKGSSGRAPGEHFVVGYESADTPEVVTSHATAEEAAGAFLARREELGI